MWELPEFIVAQPAQKGNIENTPTRSCVWRALPTPESASPAPPLCCRCCSWSLLPVRGHVSRPLHIEIEGATLHKDDALPDAVSTQALFSIGIIAHNTPRNEKEWENLHHHNKTTEKRGLCPKLSEKTKLLDNQQDRKAGSASQTQRKQNT